MTFEALSFVAVLFLLSVDVCTPYSAISRCSDALPSTIDVRRLHDLRMNVLSLNFLSLLSESRDDVRDHWTRCFTNSASLFFSAAYTFYFARLGKEEEIVGEGTDIAISQQDWNNAKSNIPFAKQMRTLFIGILNQRAITKLNRN